MDTAEVTYSTKQAAQIVGLTYRQIDYWARTGLLEPQVAAQGTGSRRGYTRDTLVGLRVAKYLLDMGVKLEVVRHLFDVSGEAAYTAPKGLCLMVRGDHANFLMTEDVAELLLGEALPVGFILVQVGLLAEEIDKELGRL